MVMQTDIAVSTESSGLSSDSMMDSVPGDQSLPEGQRGDDQQSYEDIPKIEAHICPFE